jgi:hypothetical protein
VRGAAPSLREFGRLGQVAEPRYLPLDPSKSLKIKICFFCCLLEKI